MVLKRLNCPLQRLFILIIIIKSVLSEEVWFNNKDFSLIKRVITKCENDTSKYSCLANKAAIAIERISNKDVPLFDGIVLKKQRGGFDLNVSKMEEERSFTGISRLKKVVTKFFNNHILFLDLTKYNLNEERAGGGGGGGGGYKISKKEKRNFWYSMVVLLGIFGLTGPLVMKALTLIAGKALIASKIALLMVGSVALKKIFAHDNSNGVKVHTHTVPIYDEHDRIYNVGQEHKFIYPSSVQY